MAHTPGPWHAVKNPQREDGLFVVRERRADEAERYPGELPPAVVPMQLRHADAHLIAAAPDLLAALKGLGSRGGCFCEFGIGNPMFRDHSVACAQARAAIEKAEG